MKDKNQRSEIIRSLMHSTRGAEDGLKDVRQGEFMVDYDGAPRRGVLKSKKRVTVKAEFGLQLVLRGQVDPAPTCLFQSRPSSLADLVNALMRGMGKNNLTISLKLIHAYSMQKMAWCMMRSKINRSFLMSNRLELTR